MDKFGYSLTFMKSKKAGGLEAIGNQIQVLTAATPPSPVPAVFANPDYIPVTDANYSDTVYNKFTNISFGLEYKLAPGFMPYAEFSHFNFKDSSAVRSNSGNVILLGSRLTF